VLNRSYHNIIVNIHGSDTCTRLLWISYLSLTFTAL